MNNESNQSIMIIILSILLFIFSTLSIKDTVEQKINKNSECILKPE